MSEDMKSIIDMKLQIIDEHIKELPKIKVIYIVKEKLKTVEKYIGHIGNIKRIDKVHQELIFNDKFKINIREENNRYSCMQGKKERKSKHGF